MMFRLHCQFDVLSIGDENVRKEGDPVSRSSVGLAGEKEKGSVPIDRAVASMASALRVQADFQPA